MEVDLASEDAVLVTAAKTGDSRAFGTLVRRHQRKLLAVALRSSRVREDAEDVVQQSLQKAFFHLHKFEGKSSFSTWLTRITINEGLIVLRHRRGLSEVSTEDSDSDGGEKTSFELQIPYSAPSPENNYLQHEQNRIVSSAVKQLNPRIRKAIELRDLGELSTKETARALGVSMSAVETRVFRGRRKLRESLRSYAEPALTHHKEALQTACASER